MKIKEQFNEKEQPMRIGLWVEHPFQLYSAKPIADKYLKRGNEVYLITEIKDIALCSKYLHIPPEKILVIRSFKRKWHTRFRLLFEILFVPDDYSIVYRERIVRKESGLFQMLRKIFILKMKKENVNKNFGKYRKFLFMIGFRPNLPVKINLLISFTKIYNVLMVPHNIPHISIMESWDHPIKLPYFIFPEYNLTWNEDLKNDTIRTQGLKNVRQIQPLKFRYIFERETQSDSELWKGIKNKAFIDELNQLKLEDKKIIMYPTTTSSEGIEHAGEMKLIEDLCESVSGTNYILYIKPKPNGPNGDYDCFNNNKNVMVGLYSSNPDARDMLNEEYHTFRYFLLKLSDTIINAGTTFVLEAALMNKKIIQLKLDGDRFGGFNKFINTYHLKKYILSNPYLFHYKGDKEELYQAIKNANMDFSSYIKPWITRWNSPSH